MKPCRWCDQDFAPASRAQAFCSRQCASLHQHSVSPRPRRSQQSSWPERKSPERKQAYDSTYRKVRGRLVAEAVGTPCPSCGQTLTRSNATADHVVPVARGGRTVIGNVRIVHSACNAAAGSRLGNETRRRRRRGY